MLAEAASAKDDFQSVGRTNQLYNQEHQNSIPENPTSMGDITAEAKEITNLCKINLTQSKNGKGLEKHPRTLF